jgi:hypothetical protein
MSKSSSGAKSDWSSLWFIISFFVYHKSTSNNTHPICIPQMYSIHFHQNTKHQIFDHPLTDHLISKLSNFQIRIPTFFPTTHTGTKVAPGLIYARSAPHSTHACAFQAFHLAEIRLLTLSRTCQCSRVGCTPFFHFILLYHGYYSTFFSIWSAGPDGFHF